MDVSIFDSPALRVVMLGTGLLGFVSGALGSFAVLRKQSLLGDAVSHAALPGIVVAFLINPDGRLGMPSLWLILGATFAGWLAAYSVEFVVRSARLPFDAALGGVLAVFFGLGIVLLTYAKKHVPGASRAGLETFLFGQAAILLESDVWLIAGVGLSALAVMVLMWKEFRLLAFDPEFARGLGWPIRLLETMLSSLLVAAIVIGLRCVGVVLMSALLVAPAIAARQWTNRLGLMVGLAGLFGATAGVTGTIVSHLTSLPGKPVPTGPTIVLCATAIVVFSLTFAPCRGLIWHIFHIRRNQ